MITFQHDEINCKIFVDSGLNLPKATLVFKWEALGPVQAAAITKILNDRLYDIVSNAREEAYNVGYKDGKNKRRIKTWFRGRL